jgi:hypothetical protein
LHSPEHWITLLARAGYKGDPIIIPAPSIAATENISVNEKTLSNSPNLKLFPNPVKNILRVEELTIW